MVVVYRKLLAVLGFVTDGAQAKLSIKRFVVLLLSDAFKLQAAKPRIPSALLGILGLLLACLVARLAGRLEAIFVPLAAMEAFHGLPVATLRALLTCRRHTFSHKGSVSGPEASILEGIQETLKVIGIVDGCLCSLYIAHRNPFASRLTHALELSLHGRGKGGR